jgi:hypothetical protein
MSAGKKPKILRFLENKHLIDFPGTKELVLANAIPDKDRQPKNIKVRKSKQISLDTCHTSLK